MAATALLALAPPANATFPGRNGRVAYWSPGGLHQGLFTMAPDGARRRRLIGMSRVMSPRWSPDGRRLVFRGARTQDSLTRNYVVAADGHGLHKLARDAGSDAAWTRDGRSILGLRYHSGRRSSWTEVWRQSVRSGRLRRVAVVPWSNRLDLSPARDEAALALGDGGLAVLDLTTHRLRVIFGGPDVFVNSLNWSPDGRRLAFAVDDCRDLPCRINTLDVVGRDGRDLRVLTSDRLRGLEEPHWSPDGRTIAYCRHEQARYGLRSARYSIRPDGTHNRRERSLDGCDGDWQPLPRAARSL